MELGSICSLSSVTDASTLRQPDGKLCAETGGEEKRAARLRNMEVSDGEGVFFI